MPGDGGEFYARRLVRRAFRPSLILPAFLLTLRVLHIGMARTAEFFFMRVSLTPLKYGTAVEQVPGRSAPTRSFVILMRERSWLLTQRIPWRGSG